MEEFNMYKIPKVGFFVNGYGIIEKSKIIGEDKDTFIKFKTPSGIPIGYHKSRLKSWTGYQTELFV